MVQCVQRDHARAIGVREGTFRLYFDVSVAPGDGAVQAPDSLRTSNAFVVHTVE
jgi:hypothetical protein